jgi:DNA-binding NarL/FixJ family response regulator
LKPIRILLAETPPMLTAILRDIAEFEADVELIGAVSLGDAIEHVLSESRADVLIVGVTEPDNAGFAGSLLMASPGTRVLMVAKNGARAVMYELHPIKTELGDVTAQGLLHAIRRGGPAVR